MSHIKYINVAPDGFGDIWQEVPISPEEEALETKKITNEKWAIVKERWAQITVTVGAHTYAGAYENIKSVKDEMLIGSTITWIEDSGKWTVDKAELSIVVQMILEARQNIINEVFV